MNNYKAIAFTYRDLPIDLIGRLVLADSQLERLSVDMKCALQADEFCYLSTCNRVLIIISSQSDIQKNNLEKVLKIICPSLVYEELFLFMERAKIYKGVDAVEYCMRVASSINSLVVGEKEILGQMRRAYDFALGKKLCQEQLGMLFNKVLKTAKEVFLKTEIATNPVSVVSLAYRKWDKIMDENQKGIIFVGAGKTVANFCDYIPTDTQKPLYFFNRSVENIKKFAKKTKAKSFLLSELKNFREEFDTIVTCTGSTSEIITPEIFSAITKNKQYKIIIIDLAVPQDVSSRVAELDFVNYIDIVSLQDLANKNLKEREKELPKAVTIIRERLCEFAKEWNERKVEIAMNPIPSQIKKIKEKALNEIFSKEIDSMDLESKKTLIRMAEYLEKKYIAVSIKTAKKILIEEKHNLEFKNS